MATIERYQTKGGATVFRVRYRTPAPEHRSTQKRGFKTKRDAELFAATVEVDKARGAYVAPSVGRRTIGELGPAWLARQQGHLRPSGYRTYESGWRMHVEPRWGTVRLSDVRYSDVQAWVSGLATRRGPSIVRTAHSVLARILDDAVRDRMLASNPAHGVKLPPKSPPRNVYLTAGQLALLADESGRYKGLVYLLGVGGLRWGEASAVRVGDVDFLRRRVHLTRNAVMVSNRVIVGPLKSHKNRTVALPQFVVDTLAATAAGKGRDELLWSTAAGTPLGPPAPSASWLAYAVARCRKTDRSFPRITAHALRHTAVSLAISAGANPKVVQRMLGHASAAMTLDVYADLFESDLDAVAESVAKMWPRASGSH
jgi:integrase